MKSWVRNSTSGKNVESKVRTVWPAYALLLIAGTVATGLLLHIEPQYGLGPANGSAITATPGMPDDIEVRLRAPLVILLLRLLQSIVKGPAGMLVVAVDELFKRLTEARAARAGSPAVES